MQLIDRRIKITVNISLGFISRSEFADVIKLLLHGEHGNGEVNQAYVDELCSAMDFDKNGKIDMNEFLGRIPIEWILPFVRSILESFRIVHVKKPTNKGRLSNGNNTLKIPDSSSRRPSTDGSKRRDSIDTTGRRPSIDSSGRRQSTDAGSRRQSIDMSGKRPSVDHSGRKLSIK